MYKSCFDLLLNFTCKARTNYLLRSLYCIYFYLLIVVVILYKK